MKDLISVEPFFYYIPVPLNVCGKMILLNRKSLHIPLLRCTVYVSICVCVSDCVHMIVPVIFFFVSYSMYHGILGLQSYTSSGFIGCGPLKHIVAVLCDLLSVLQAFSFLLSRSVVLRENAKR